MIDSDHDWAAFIITFCDEIQLYNTNEKHKWDEQADDKSKLRVAFDILQRDDCKQLNPNRQSSDEHWNAIKVIQIIDNLLSKSHYWANDMMICEHQWWAKQSDRIDKSCAYNFDRAAIDGNKLTTKIIFT